MSTGSVADLGDVSSGAVAEAPGFLKFTFGFGFGQFGKGLLGLLLGKLFCLVVSAACSTRALIWASGGTAAGFLSFTLMIYIPFLVSTGPPSSPCFRVKARLMTSVSPASCAAGAVAVNSGVSVTLTPREAAAAAISPVLFLLMASAAIS